MKKKVEKESVETMTEQIPEQSKGKRIANTIVNVVLVVAIVLAALCTYTSYVSTAATVYPASLVSVCCPSRRSPCILR